MVKRFRPSGPTAEAAVFKPKRVIPCPDHGILMQYDPTEDQMKCSAVGCSRVKRRRLTMRNLLGSAGIHRGQLPAAYRGRLSIVVDEEDRPWLYLEDIYAVVDLSRLVTPVLEADKNEPIPKMVLETFISDPQTVEIKYNGKRYVRP